MRTLFNNKSVSTVNKLNITSFKKGANEANDAGTKSSLVSDMASSNETRENNRETTDTRKNMEYNRSSSDPNLGEAFLDRDLSQASGYSTPNKGHSSPRPMPGVGESTASMNTTNGITNALTGTTTTTLSPGRREEINGTEDMNYATSSIGHNRTGLIQSQGTLASKDEFNRRYYDPYRTNSDSSGYTEAINQLYTMKSSPEVTRGDQGGFTGENTRTSSEPARLDHRSGLEKESSISSDYCLFNENYGKCNFSDFSKNNLVLLLSFINTITRETLPVKCILLTLKTLLRCVKCELIELCQIDDNNLIINYMFKEGMLHKKEVKYHKKGLYNLALSTGMMIKVDDVSADERYNKDCDQHTELTPRNMVLIPLYNLQHSIWGVVSLSNYRGGASASAVGARGTYEVPLGVVSGSTGSSNCTTRGVSDFYGTGSIGNGPLGSDNGPGSEFSRAVSSDSNLEREDSLMDGVNNSNATSGGGMATDFNLVVVANNRDIFGTSSTMSNIEGNMERFSGLNGVSEPKEINTLHQEGSRGKTSSRFNSVSSDGLTGNIGSNVSGTIGNGEASKTISEKLGPSKASNTNISTDVIDIGNTSISGSGATGTSAMNSGKDTSAVASNEITNNTTNTVTASSNHSPPDSRHSTINSINSIYGSRNGNINGVLGNSQVGATGYNQMDEEKLKFISYLCFMSGIIISNAMEKIELEINKLKSNSLITLMHSLFSDQLGIQSCVIALTTHAKKLIQAESCAVYLVDQSRNQLWSISSNTGEQSLYSLDDNNILSICVNTSKIIIYDNDLVNDGNLLNKSNILAISNGTSVFDSSESTEGVSSGASNASSKMSGNSLLLGPTTHGVNGRGAESTTGLSEVGVDKEVLEKLRMLRNGIWVPIKHDNRVLAVIEVVNKQAQELLHFTEDDLNLLELFAVIVGPQFERSEFASAGLAKKTTEAGLAFENVDKYLNNNVKNFIEQSIIEEEEVIME